MSRRDVDRQRGDRGDRDDYRSNKPARDGAPAARKQPNLNEYFIDGEGINRQVLQSEICKWLGAEATCRPGEYNGRPGYKIKALRPFTPDMLEDLKAASKDFTLENRERLRSGGHYGSEVSYEESSTLQARSRNFPDSYTPGNDDTPSRYNMPSPYGQDPSINAFASQMYSSGPSYSSAFTMAPNVAGMSAHAPQGDQRRYQNYTYGQQPSGADYPGYYPPGYQPAPRNTGPDTEMGGYGYPSGQNVPPRMEDPRVGYYDSPMGGVPPSMQQPGYPSNRQPNAPGYVPDYSRQQSADPYGQGRRR